MSNISQTVGWITLRITFRENLSITAQNAYQNYSQKIDALCLHNVFNNEAKYQTIQGYGTNDN